MPTLEQMARAALSGWTGGLLGWPADTAVSLANLAKAGYGVAGHKLGLLGTADLPEMTNPEDVPITSSWIAKTMGVGDSMPEQAAQLLGGLLSPSIGVKKAPVQSDLTVYHGSPHKFDKFDASKIGTGEGAQAYGHGLYLAESPKVAQEYANLKPITDPTDGGFIQARAAWAEAKGNPKAALAYLDKQEKIVSNAKDMLMDKGSSSFADIARARELIKGGQLQPGNLYTVDLPDAWIPKMLDWDKPLSQQPEEVRKLFGPVDPNGRISTQLAYERWIKQAGVDPVAASEQFKSLGYPGIRYLDGGSRAAGQGSYNYVVFPGMEQYLKILGVE